MKILKQEFLDLPGLGKASWDTGTISIMVTQDQIQEMEKIHGIDVIAMVENAIANEVYQFLAKTISNVARNKKSEEIKWQRNSAYWLSDLIAKQKPLFIITNLKVGVGLQDMSGFEKKDMAQSFSSNGCLYELGKWDGVSVYIDPNMLYSEEEMALVGNDFLEYEVDEETVKIITEGTNAPKITINFRYKISGVKSTVYEIKELGF